MIKGTLKSIKKKVVSQEREREKESEKMRCLVQQSETLKSQKEHKRELTSCQSMLHEYDHLRIEEDNPKIC